MYWSIYKYPEFQNLEKAEIKGILKAIDKDKHMPAWAAGLGTSLTVFLNGLLFSLYKMSLPTGTYFTMWQFAFTIVIFIFGGMVAFSILYFFGLNFVYPRYIKEYMVSE